MPPDPQLAWPGLGSLLEPRTSRKPSCTAHPSTAQREGSERPGHPHAALSPVTRHEQRGGAGGHGQVGQGIKTFKDKGLESCGFWPEAWLLGALGLPLDPSLAAGVSPWGLMPTPSGSLTVLSIL